MIVQLADESNIEPVGAAVEDNGGLVTFEFPTLSMLAAHIPAASIKNVSAALVDNQGVEKVWLDAKVYADLEVSVPLVGAPDVWGSFRGEGMIIAVLDTGIDATHADLNDLDDDDGTTDPKVLRSVDCTGVATPDPALCTEAVPGNDDPNGHGSHVSGIAAGTGQASGGSRSGVAPGAFLWNVRVLNAGGSGFNSWIIAGILTASLGPDGVAGTDDEAHVINMSLGGGPTDGTDPLALAVDAAVDAGLVVATSAGNSGPGMGTVGTPGSARKAFTVGATDDFDAMAGFSSRGPISDLRLKPDITAPGVGTLAPAAGSGTGYTSKSGTSMSSPHVAGASALVRQANPDWSPEQVKAALMNNALVLTGPRLWDQGAGRLRVPEAVFTPLVATPPSFSFGEIGGVSVAETTGTLTVENVSDAELTVNLAAVTTLDGVPSDIVSVLPTTLVIPVDGSGDATITVAPGSGDGPGMYEGRVIITELGALASGDERTVPYLFVLETFPDIGVAPSSFSETVVLQELLTKTLTISNTGTGPLNFIVGAVGTGSSGDAITILETQTRSASASNTSSVDEVTSTSYTYGVLEGGPMILMYSSDHDLGAGNTYADAALQQLGLAYTGFFADPGGFSAALTGGGPWDLVVLDVPSDEPGFGDVEAYIAGGGRVIASTWDPDPSFFTAMEVNPIQSIGAPQPVYRWDTGHPIFNTPEAIPDLTSLSDDWADDGDEVEPIGTGVAIGGFTPGPTVNEAGIVIGDGNRTIMNSFLLAEVNGDDDADGTTDAIELWINEIQFMLGGGVSWLCFEPSSGTVPSGGSLGVMVKMNCERDLALGTYTADILVSSNDLDENPVVVPVSLIVGPGLPPEIDVTPIPLDVIVAVGQVFTTQLNIANTATTGGVLSFSISDAHVVSLATADAPWLSENPTSGFVNPGGNLDVDITFDATGLAIGPYTADLTISNNDLDEDPVVVPVTMTVEQPDIVVVPASFDFTLDRDMQETADMMVGNTGLAPLIYEIHVEMTGGVSLGTPELLNVITQTRTASGTNQGVVDEVTVASYTLGTLTDGPSILVYTDDYVEGPGTTFVEQALIALGLPATVFYGDYDGFGAALGAGPSALAVWDLVIVSHNNFFELGNYWVELEAYFNGGGKLLIATFDIDGSHSEATTLWDTLGVQQVLDQGLPEPLYRWDEGHPVFTSPEAVPDMTSPQDDYIDDGDRTEPGAGATAIAGFSPEGTVLVE